MVETTGFFATRSCGSVSFSFRAFQLSHGPSAQVSHAMSALCPYRRRLPQMTIGPIWHSLGISALPAVCDGWGSQCCCQVLFLQSGGGEVREPVFSYDLAVASDPQAPYDPVGGKISEVLTLCVTAVTPAVTHPRARAKCLRVRAFLLIFSTINMILNTDGAVLAGCLICFQITFLRVP